jgi:tetratricopeptide (TPR) repeat protein
MNRGGCFAGGSWGGRIKILNDPLLIAIIVSIGLLAAGLPLAGAAPPDGAALFEKGNYDQARQVLSSAVTEAPDDPRAQFYLGRTYLALEEAAQALPHLQKAVRLAPQNAVYHFWLGVNYWALLDLDRELAAYEQALALDPDLLPAHVYAGHNLLDRGQWASALEHYNAVLQVLPEHPEALYNAGVALKALGRDKEAMDAWRRFLQHHQDDPLAVAAARNLNVSGDFSYRVFAVGKRFVVGPSPGFQEGTLTIDPQLIETLDEIGRIIRGDAALDLHIVTFLSDNKEMAAQRAKAVKAYLSGNSPGISPARVHISWFDQPETLQNDDHKYNLKASINIFAAKEGGTTP